MKAVSASFVLGCALSLVACGPSGRPDDGDDDPTDTTPDAGTTSEPRKCGKMDIVFVVDDSGSMSEEQSNLGQNFPMFADVLLNYTNADGDHIDFRVAVTTTGRDMDYTVSFGGQNLPVSEDGDNGAFRTTCGVSRGWLEPGDPNLGSTLGCRAGVGTEGPGYEMPLLMTKWALGDRVMDGTNAGFLREDALLGVVVLTDENDSSTTANNFVISGPGSEPPIDFQPEDLISFLDGLKGHRTRWAAGVIAGESNCSSSFGDAVESVRLKDFVLKANANGTPQAVFSSICAGNLTTALTEVLNKFQSACGQIIL